MASGIIKSVWPTTALRAPGSNGPAPVPGAGAEPTTQLTATTPGGIDREGEPLGFDTCAWPHGKPHPVKQTKVPRHPSMRDRRNGE